MKTIKILGAIIVCICIYSSSFAQTSTNDQLEKRIADLEKRVATLEKMQGNGKQQAITLNPNIKDKSIWRKLEKGMTKSQVSFLLGEPLNVITTGPFTYWHYSNKSFESSVDFYNDVVDGWEEPR